MRRVWIVPVLTFWAGSPSALRADVIAYTNLGNNDAYAYPSFVGSGIIGGNLASRTEAAFKFTPTVGGDITKIRLALGTNFAVNQGTVTLYGDDSNYPDPERLRLTLAGVPVFDITMPGNALPLTVINVNGGNRRIVAGTSYWLSVSPGLPNLMGDPSALVWFDNSTGIRNSFAQRTDPPRPRNEFVVFPNTPLGAFEITVAEVPEPTFVPLLCLSLVAVALFSRKSRRLASEWRLGIAQK
jgi:hypothetical protein